MKYIPLLVLFLLPARVSAADAPKLLTEPPPKTVKFNEVVKFTAKDSYHFNIEAPQKCGATEAFDLSSASVKCQFSSGGTQAVSLKLCADKQSMCLFEEFTIEVKGAHGAAKAAVRDPAASEPPLPGFLQNDTARALRLAGEGGKLIFADFFTRWCPFCRLMEDTVLNRPAFMEASGNMVRVSLDGDTPQAREWLTRFRPAGYPTYIVMDAGMREIGRMSGNTSVEAFAAWLKEQENWKTLPIADAKAKAAALDEGGKLRVAKVYIEEKNRTEALKLLAGIKTREAEYLAADCRLESAAASAEKAGLPALYRENIARFDGSDGQPAVMGVVGWITALHKLEPAAAGPWLGDAGALAGRLIRSPEATAEGYTAEDIYITLGEALDKAEMKDKAKEMFSKAADGYAALAAKAGRPEAAKGLRMSQAGNLANAGRYEDAAAVYGELAGAFPGEYPFHRSLSSMLFKMKKYPEALREASLAAGLAYGDIRLEILYSKAKIETEMKNRAAALKTLDGAIASIELPGDPQLKTHRVYAKLKDYRKEVEALK
jgi:tetratricopeptide (TPR) repeat protein